jgi:hypothetical protein
MRHLTGKRILLASAAEDADYFCDAVAQGLTARGAIVSKACFWLDRVSFPVAELGVAHRVVRSFVQPSATDPDMVVFARSIMDSKSEWLAISSYLKKQFSGCILDVSVIVGFLSGFDLWPNGGAMGEYLGFEPSVYDCAHDGSGLAMSAVSAPLHVRYGFQDLTSLWHEVPQCIADEMRYDPEKHLKARSTSGFRM